MARRRFSQKSKEPICFFALQSGNTWNLKSKFKNSSISGLSWQKNTNSFVRLRESMARQSAFGFIWPLAFCQKVWWSLKRIGQINHLSRKFEYLSCLLLWTGNSNFLLRRVIWHTFFFGVLTNIANTGGWNVWGGWNLTGNQDNHQNFVPSLISKNLWLIFLGMKDFFSFERNIPKLPTPKNWGFQNRQFSIIFA